MIKLAKVLTVVQTVEGFFLIVIVVADWPKLQPFFTAEYVQSLYDLHHFRAINNEFALKSIV